MVSDGVLVLDEVGQVRQPHGVDVESEAAVLRGERRGERKREGRKEERKKGRKEER